jgi:hypothetical protein
MKRRTFIAGLGSTAAWPVRAQAQQSDRVRRLPRCKKIGQGQTYSSDRDRLSP